MPDLYIWQMPLTNAMAIGSKKPIVVLNSGTVSLMDEHELRTVLGHEAGHILSDHVLYQTALYILLADRRRPAAAAAVLRRACRCWRSGSRCSSGSAPPSSAATARRRSSPAAR